MELTVSGPPSSQDIFLGQHICRERERCRLFQGGSRPLTALNLLGPRPVNEWRAPESVPAPRVGFGAPASDLGAGGTENGAAQGRPETPFSAQWNPSSTVYLFDGALGKKKKNASKIQRAAGARLPSQEFLAGCTSRRSGEAAVHSSLRSALRTPGGSTDPAPGGALPGRGGAASLRENPEAPAPRSLQTCSPFPRLLESLPSAPLGHSCGSEFGAGTARPAGPSPRQRPGRFLAQLSHPFQPSLFPGLPISPGSSRPAAPVPEASLTR